VGVGGVHRQAERAVVDVVDAGDQRDLPTTCAVVERGVPGVVGGVAGEGYGRGRIRRPVVDDHVGAGGRVGNVGDRDIFAVQVERAAADCECGVTGQRADGVQGDGAGVNLGPAGVTVGGGE